MRIREDIELGNLRDSGRQRTENEDCYCFVAPESEEEFPGKRRQMAIADGTGGLAGGQIASTLALELLREVFQNGPQSDPGSVLAEGFSQAQTAIVAPAEEHPELNGMGTTCTAAILRSGQLWYGHVGDDGRLEQLTKDHTLVHRVLKNGSITPDLAAVHPRRNVLTAALGMKGNVLAADVSYPPMPLCPRDVVLLASDGLHGLVSNEEIQAAASTQTPARACHVLVEAAKLRDGPDNITVQILRFKGGRDDWNAD